jgi:hypothetical protein
MKENKVKEIENSELLLRIKVREYIDEQGRHMIETKWVKANGEVNLGSSAKPNPEIIEFKYNVPDDKENILNRLFGGREE